MVGKKSTRIISFLIIILFAVQLVPIGLGHADGVHSHTQNSGEFFILLIVHSGIFIESSSLRTSLLKVPTKYASCCIHYAIIADISLNASTYQGVPFDCRRVIEQTIPQHFHGGKYKQANLYT